MARIGKIWNQNATSSEMERISLREEKWEYLGRFLPVDVGNYTVYFLQGSYWLHTS